VTEGKIDTWKLVDHVPHLVSPQCYQLRIQLYVHVQKDEKNKSVGRVHTYQSSELLRCRRLPFPAFSDGVGEVKRIKSTNTQTGGRFYLRGRWFSSARKNYRPKKHLSSFVGSLKGR